MSRQRKTPAADRRRRRTRLRVRRTELVLCPGGRSSTQVSARTDPHSVTRATTATTTTARPLTVSRIAARYTPRVAWRVSATACIATLVGCFSQPPAPAATSGGDGGAGSDGAPPNDGSKSPGLCQNRTPINSFDMSTTCTGGVGVGGGMATMSISTGQANCTFSIQSMDSGILVEVASLSPSGTSGNSAVAKLSVSLIGNVTAYLSMTQFAGATDNVMFTTNDGGGQVLPIHQAAWLLLQANSDRMITARVTEDADPATATWLDVQTEGFAPNTTTQAGSVTIGLQVGGGSGSDTAVFENLDYCL